MDKVTVHDHEGLPGFRGTELCDSTDEHPGFKTCEGIDGVGSFTRTTPGQECEHFPRSN